MAQAAGLCRRPQALDRVDPERLVKRAHRPRPDTGHVEHLEHARGDLGLQLVVREPSGLGELGQLRRQRGSGARDLRRLAASKKCGDVVRVALDDVGDATVCHRLVDDLAEDLEHVADLVEDACHLGVRDHRVAAARHGTWTRHWRPF